MNDGLRAKYIVRKAETGEAVENCFVLRPEKDPAAIAAIRAYAAATNNPALSADLLRWVGPSPNTDVAPVRYGRWIGEGDGYAETGDGEMALVYDVWRCSECEHMIDDGTDDLEQLPNYCPHCGAKMDLAAAWPEGV